MTADAAGRAPENVFQKLEKYAVSFRGCHLISLFCLFNLKREDFSAKKNFIG